MTDSGATPTRILYVEDDSNLRYTLSRLLQHLGYEVEVAIHGKEGVEKTLSWQPHLILMDIRMPVMGGIEALRQLRANPETADIPVLMISAYTDSTTRRQAQEAGAQGFVSKPPNMARVHSLIQKTLNKE